CVIDSTANTMPMNAPVTLTTGTERVPTSYICGNTSRTVLIRKTLAPSQANVRATKMQKSPNAASALFVFRPTRSIRPTGMGASYERLRAQAIRQTKAQFLPPSLANENQAGSLFAGFSQEEWAFATRR